MPSLSAAIFSFKSLPHRQAFKLAGPMILANISTPAMGLVDTAMLGHLNEAKFMGAVAIGANVLAFLFWMFAFLRMGTTSLTGRAYGAGHETLILRRLVQNALVAISLGVLIIALQFVTIPLAMGLMAPVPEIRELASSYCHIRIHAAPAVLLMYVILGWFIGLHNTRLPLVITVTANTLNVVLDYFFILRFGWESDGAALASLLSEYIALLIALLAMVAHVQKFSGAIKKAKLSLWRNLQWRALLSLNSDLFVRTSILLFVFNFFTAKSAGLGENFLAANAIIMQLVLFSSLALDGYAHAAETMIARTLGAKDINGFYRACAATAFAAFSIALFLSSAFTLANKTIVSIMSNLDSVVTTTIIYLPWLYLLPLISVWCYLFDGVFIGAGQTRVMRNYMVFAVLFVFLPFWWLFQPLQNHGLWAAFTLFNLFRGLSLGFAFRKLSRDEQWLDS